jgi:hypothetical protein
MLEKKKNPIPKWWIWTLAVLIIGATGCSSKQQEPSASTSTNAANQQKDTSDQTKQEPSHQQEQTTPSSQNPVKSEVQKKSQPVIDKQIFDRLKHGMTLNEVFSLVGGPGDIVSKSGNPDDPLYTVTYQYKGESPNSYAKLTFRSGKLLDKEQAGLR